MARHLRKLKTLIRKGHPVAVCFGAGVDSTAMLILLQRENITPDIITFADTGAEKPETYAHVHHMNQWLSSVGFPSVTTCQKLTLPSTDYDDLAGNCLANETLPSLAFGMKSCSIKWKQSPQDYAIKGCKAPHNKIQSHPIWEAYQRTGKKIVKLIGYDNGKADIRRSSKLKSEDRDFIYHYPLQEVKWARPECVAVIEAAGVNVPVKSACFFCPASQKWELFWLAGNHPELFMKALEMERTALTGRHSRFEADVDWVTWEEMIREFDDYPSLNTTVGLGRSFAWNHWAVINKVVDDQGRFIGDRSALLGRAEALQANGGNAADARTCAGAM